MRWIRVVDVETTGMEDDSEVVEFAQTVVADHDHSAGLPRFHPFTEEEMEAHDLGTWRVSTPSESCLYTPSKPLSPEVRAIHGLEMSDLPADLPFREYGHNAWSWRGRPGSEAAIACHNADFDRRFVGHLAGDTPFLCTYKCALRLWPDAPSHSNNALRYWLQDRQEWPASFLRSHAEPAHRSGPDSYVTAHLLVTMLQTTPLEILLQWSAEPKQLVKMPLGKHRGARFDALPLDYLQWAARSDMGEDIKAACRQELTRRADVRAPKPPGVTAP